MRLAARRAHLLAFALLFAPFISGCSLSPIITTNSVDYNRTVEDVTTSVLITNILRARDRAPLFFSDLSQIRGSLALNVSAQVSSPFGPQYRATTRGAAQGGPISVNSQPTFDIAPLNTKQFSQGILEPISPNILGYYLQRGVPPALILNMLISRVDVYSPAGRGNQLVRSIPWTVESPNQLTEMLHRWASNSTMLPVLKQFSQVVPFGPPVEGNAEQVIQASTSGLGVREVNGKLQMLKPSAYPVLCVSEGPNSRYIAIGISQNSVRSGPGELQIPPSDAVCSTGKSHFGRADSHRYVVTLRSVQGVFHYLGSLLKLESPPIPFRIQEGRFDDTRIAVDYRGATYSVANVPEDSSDLTMSVLAILNDLLNINRDANEIPSTKAFHALN